MSSVLKESTNDSARALMLLCQEGDVSGVVEVGDEQRVEAAGEVAHDAAADLAPALSLGGAAGGGGPWFWGFRRGVGGAARPVTPGGGGSPPPGGFWGV